MIKGKFICFFNFPPRFPEKQTEIIPFFFATFAASIKLLLLPEVVSAIAISPFWPMASSCLEKINLKPKSLPAAVIAELSEDKEIAEKGFLFFYILLLIL